MICQRHPLLPSAIAYVTGTAVGLSLDIAPASALSVSIAVCTVFLAAVVLFSGIPPLAKSVLCCLALASLAAFAANLADHPRDKAFSYLNNLSRGNERCNVRLFGEVSSMRKPKKAAYGENEYRFRLKKAVLLDGNRQTPLDASIPVIWYGHGPERGGLVPKKGMLLEIEGRVRARRRAKNSSNAGADDFFIVSRARNSAEKSPPRTADTLSRWRESSAQKISLALEKFPKEEPLLLAMTLGYRSDIDYMTNQAFRIAGTIHIFAISGIHVFIISGFILYVMTLCGVPLHCRIFLLTPLLAFYVAAIGAPPSAMRAGLMCALQAAAPLFMRRASALDTVAVSALVLLAFEPQQLRELSFILSYAIVTGLIIFSPPVTHGVRLFARIGRFESVIALESAALQRGFAWSKAPYYLRRTLCALASKTLNVVGGTLSATLVSLPLTAYYFDFFPVYSFFANLLVVPLAGVTMLLASSALLMSYISEAIAALPFALAAICARFMRELSMHISGLPGASPETQFPLWGVAAWYLAVMIAVRLIPEKPSHRRP